MLANKKKKKLNLFEQLHRYLLPEIISYTDHPREREANDR